MLAVMKDFVNQMRDSQFCLQSAQKVKENQGILVGKLNEKVQVTEQKPLSGIGQVSHQRLLSGR